MAELHSSSEKEDGMVDGPGPSSDAINSDFSVLWTKKINSTSLEGL